jgi:hypothetical protein
LRPGRGWAMRAKLQLEKRIRDLRCSIWPQLRHAGHRQIRNISHSRKSA